VDTGETLVVFSVEPSFLFLWGVYVGLTFYALVVLFKKINDDLVVVVIGANMQKGAVLGICHLVDDGQQTLEELLGLLLVEGLDSLEKLFLVYFCHIYIVVADDR
jgi:hypothetical protein